MAEVTNGEGDPPEPLPTRRRSLQEAVEYAEEFAELLAAILRLGLNPIHSEKRVSVTWRNDLLEGLAQFTETDNPVIDVLRLSAAVFLELKTKLTADDAPGAITYGSLAEDVSQAEAKVRRAVQRFKEQRGSRLLVNRSVVTLRVTEEKMSPDLADQMTAPDPV